MISRIALMARLDFPAIAVLGHIIEAALDLDGFDPRGDLLIGPEAADTIPGEKASANQ
jgi:hypothetical protein